MPQDMTNRQEIAPVELLPVGAISEMPGMSNIQQTWQVLLRRKWLVLGITLLITAVAALVIFALTPLYTADAYVIIDERHRQVVKVDDVLPAQTVDLEMVQSEIQVMRSRKLIGRVVDKLALDANPLFNPTLRPKSLWRSWAVELQSNYAAVAERFGLPSLTIDDQKLLTPVEVHSNTVDEILRRLEVGQEGKSRVMKVQFTSSDPAVAAAVANTLADLYVTSRLEAKFEERAQAAKWLNERLTDLKDQVRTADVVVDDFRRSAQLTGGIGGTPAAQQLTDLNAQLIAARAARVQAEANLRQAQKLVATSGDEGAINAVLQSPVIQQLEMQASQVARKVADLSQVYGDRHPKLADAKVELAELHKKIRQEGQKVVSGMSNDLAAAQSREASLQQAVGQLQGELARQNSADIKLRALQGEANANHALLDIFLQRSKEISPDRTFETTDAQIISKAEVPRRASFPQVGILLGVALVVAGAIASGAVLGFERLDDRIRSADEVQTLLGTPALGFIPKAAGGLGFGKKSVPSILSQPSSAYSESLLNVHTGLMLSNIDTPTRIILLTSSFPGEGKTTIGVSLGRVLARSGHKVLIVDCDLRRPSAHTAFGLERDPGLTDLLVGSVHLAQAIKQDSESSAFLLPAGRKVPNPQTILASTQMKSFLKEIRDHYDLIIIDSPPIFAVSDAKILSTIVDKTVYVVRWGDTRRRNAMTGLRQLREVGADIAGVVLSAVDVDKHARYGFTDSGLYAGRLKSYYVS